MESNMTITVVLPAYNSEKYIARALDSVIAQTHKPDEIIVIDDGSTDNTSDIIRKYEPSVKLIQQQNTGASVARNAGIEAASSEWIAFLDADDEWLPEKLQFQREHLKRNPNLQWTTANFIRSDSANQQKPDICPQRLEKTLKTLAGKEYFQSYFDAYLAGSAGWTGTILIKQQTLIEAGLFQPGQKRMNDVDTWLRIAYLNLPIGFLPQPLAIYHTNIPNSTVKLHKNPRIICDFINRHLTLAEQARCLDQFKPCAARMVAWWIHCCLEDLNGPAARSILRKFSPFFGSYYKTTTLIKSLFPRAGLCYDNVKSQVKKTLFRKA
jgi:glycosyltransferase involved in cell wall biosynthesis